jgi:hypothetical protein
MLRASIPVCFPVPHRELCVSKHALLHFTEPNARFEFMVFYPFGGKYETMANKLAPILKYCRGNIRHTCAAEMVTFIGGEGEYRGRVFGYPEPVIAEIPRKDLKYETRYFRVSVRYGVLPTLDVFESYEVQHHPKYSGPMVGFVLEQQALSPEAYSKAQAKRLAAAERQRVRRAKAKEVDREVNEKMKGIRKVRHSNPEKAAEDQAFLDRLDRKAK